MGGGARPLNVPTEEKKSRTCTLYARAGASEAYIFAGLKTLVASVYIKRIIAVSFLFLRVWRYKCQYTEKTLTLRKFMYIYERAQKILAVSHSKTAISSNILLILQNFVGTYLSAYIYRQKSEKALGGGGEELPPRPLWIR